MSIVNVKIPTSSGELSIDLESGRSILFVGANGAGKTRLGVWIEDKISSEKVRRISAHRSLTMSDNLTLISLDRAQSGLSSGLADLGGIKKAHRWKQNPATALLSDYDFLLQALFADHSRASIEYVEQKRFGSDPEIPNTALLKLKDIWECLLPHRKFRLLEAGIKVIPSNGQSEYAGSQMSDGERVIFYLLGHSLLAPKDGILIIDEPELHVHKAILGRLWDLIESARPDCAFIYISHDLDFVVARPAASKYVVRAYEQPNNWEIEELPKNTELPDRVVSELIGSRQPVLFVEGERGSLDAFIYRCAFPNYLIQPIGGCEAVIHAVASFRKNLSLHRIGEVRGCVDADARDVEEIEYLKNQGVFVLSVAEIENVLLKSLVFRNISASLHFSPDEIDDCLKGLTISVLNEAKRDIEMASVRYAIRRLDSTVKKLAPASRTVEDLCSRFINALGSINPADLANEYRIKLQAVIDANDLDGVLSLYDNKGLLNIGARCLGIKGRDQLIEFVGRLLASEKNRSLLQSIQEVLPKIS